MTEVEKLKKLTGESDEELLSLLLDDASQFVLGYTNRTLLPDALTKTVRDLAVVALNRIGTEGENSRSEGGERYDFNSAPKQIFDILNRFRLVKVGGYAFETKPTQTVLPEE